MSRKELSLLAQELGRICAERVLDEKWLIAPSLRVGLQWLDAVTASGQPVLNVRVKTFTVMALELAASQMERRDASLANTTQIEVLVDALISRLRERGGYLTRLQAGHGLVRAVAATLRDLRLAGLSAARLRADLFEVVPKGREITALLSGYENELASRSLWDYAHTLEAAAGRINEDPSALPEGVLILLPEDMEQGLRGLERSLWEAVPAANRSPLAVDHPGDARHGEESDAALLTWITRPGDAPPPRGDGTAQIFRAVGEINEVREVLRRCVDGRIPFDRVEILHADASTYIPLIYELLFSHATEAGGPIPATFCEGIPVRYSRPGRALAGWLSWIREGYSQSGLVGMIQDGLLEVGTSPTREVSYSRLGAELRSLPIGAGRERYQAACDAAIFALERRIEAREKGADINGAADNKRAADSDLKRLSMLRALRGLVADLLQNAPLQGCDWRSSLEGVSFFLKNRVRCSNELDSYGRTRLMDEIASMADSLGGEDPSCIDIHDWLFRLVRDARVEGERPRPGCIYVAPLAEGGHSGRAYTFILGLDDGRFPGTGIQDPLLLDSERERISQDMPTSAARLAARLEGFARLAARIRGKITLGYCCRNLADDRDMFPSPVVLSAYRILSGNREGLQDDLLRWLAPPLSFAPANPASCIDGSEWWLHALCAEKPPEDPERAVSRVFPNLGRGLAARRARESAEFTIYDGYVPQAGEDLHPGGPDAPILSASRLEKLGRCPLEYFLHYVLGIEPPREYTLDASMWLDHAEKGELLHAVFREFMCRVQSEGRPPQLEQDQHTLDDILETEISGWRRIKPPPNREAFEADVDEMRRTARIFLHEEEQLCLLRRPLCFEAAIGLEGKGEGNLIDSPEPALIALPGGLTIRARGYIDRMDEVLGGGEMSVAVCDYKTGSSRGYDRADPFQQGRRLQSAFYLALAESRLEECHPGARVMSFEYFFPNTREHGERLRWNREELAAGLAVIGNLCEMLARGCFPFTDQIDDVRYSDYRCAFGDIAQAVRSTRVKLANPVNTVLAPFRSLRGYEDME